MSLNQYNEGLEDTENSPTAVLTSLFVQTPFTDTTVS